MPWWMLAAGALVGFLMMIFGILKAASDADDDIERQDWAEEARKWRERHER